MPDSLLIIEDEKILGAELQAHYQHADWDVTWVETFTEAKALLFERDLAPLVVLSDINLPDGNGLDLLEEERQRGGNGEWLFLTGYGGVPDSVRAMRLGAFEFLTKPCDPERLDLVLTGAARSAHAQRRLKDESVNRVQRYTPASFTGRSRAARSVREMLTKLSQVAISALIITGETGTGKGLAARILHHTGSRAHGPLVEVNCATLPHDLLESELFGHEAGAFTDAKSRRRGLLEQADGGTVFLDEIGDMPVGLQAKLLKVIEDLRFRRLGGDREIKVDIQIIAATNHKLEKQIADGGFRADLYHRLSIFELELPTLRQRIADIEDLLPVFIAEFNTIAANKINEIPDAVWQHLNEHDWPGNVRELRNVVERCVLLATDQRFPIEWLRLGSALSVNRAGDASIRNDRLCLPLDGSMSLDAMDRCIIETALARHCNNVAETSRVLQTTRQTLRYRIEKYHIKNIPQ